MEEQTVERARSSCNADRQVAGLKARRARSPTTRSRYTMHAMRGNIADEPQDQLNDPLELFRLEQPANPGELCLQCGLCCDGTLFGTITTKSQTDVEIAQREGLQSEIGADGRLVILQPCAAFKCGSCSIYDSGRPQTCGEYRCRLLDEYARGDRHLSDCLDIVATVRGTALRVDIRAGSPTGHYSRTKVQTSIEQISLQLGTESSLSPSSSEQAHLFTRLWTLQQRYFTAGSVH